jgi:pyruvate,orthophosphate dikinase
MVFGNTGERSGTGVAFTRNPATGEKAFYGEYLTNAQGEDVVAGIRTPQPVTSLANDFPAIYKQLTDIATLLEKHFHEMQDIEFTFENDRLFMLQTRDGKRTGFAAIKIAVDMVAEGLKTKEQALIKFDPDQLNQLLQPIFEPSAKQEAAAQKRIVAKGLAAGPGAATGKAVFFADEAEEMAARGEKVILIRMETSPEDIRGMNAAQGILTARGGMTSHAALVGRQMGKVCVVGCQTLEIDYEKRIMVIGGSTVKEGEDISIDGFTGEVILGRVDTKPSEVVQVLISKTLDPKDSAVYRNFAELMKWAKEARRMGIRTNADQPDQAANAVALGAEGIGLCRTEHMFFGGDRIDWVRRMILADTVVERKEALSHLLPMQRGDFKGLFEAMGGLPVTIRTLDPPLHEFLPHEDEAVEDLAKQMGVSPDLIREKVAKLAEANPMLGLRGCRLGIIFPEITEMQVRAIFEAACEVTKAGKAVKPEIMIPLVGNVNELKLQADIVHETAKQVFAEHGCKVDYLVGTMIELPRAALVADQIATVAQFFSFGTNDLTQTTYGLSRDDAGKFLPIYLEKKIIPYDPFITIDFDGVGQLMKIGVDKGRSVNANLKIGICGEHGGDPESVKFCHRLGMNYVSCSPFRVPIASIAAAQAALAEKLEMFVDK